MIKQFFKLPVLLLALSMLLAACGEGDSDHDEATHVDADGFSLRVDGTEIYRQFQGTETGGITLKVGDELDVLTVFINRP